jgi:AcrR family transcriptional regulator
MRRPDRDSVRAELVTIAGRHFAESGYQGASLAEIARDAGYSKAALLYHFRSKQELLVAVMLDRLDETDAMLDSLAEHPPGAARTAAAIDAICARVLQGRPVGPVAAAHDMTLVLASDRSLLERVEATRTRMLHLLAGPEPTPAQRLRLTLAIYGLPLALPELADLSDEQTSALVADVLRDAIDLREDHP